MCGLVVWIVFLLLCATSFMAEQTQTLLFLYPSTQYLYSRVDLCMFCSWPLCYHFVVSRQVLLITNNFSKMLWM